MALDVNGKKHGSVRPVKRSVRIAGHPTSVSLEDEFWGALKDLAKERGQSLSALLTEIDAQRGGRSLASACRVFVLLEYRKKATST